MPAGDKVAGGGLVADEFCKVCDAEVVYRC